MTVTKLDVDEIKIDFIGLKVELILIKWMLVFSLANSVILLFMIFKLTAK